MKILIFTLLLFFGASQAALAQPGGGDRGQKIEALYIAYITKQINLTEDEAKRFWPLHAQYDAEINGVAANQNELERQQAMLNVKKKYQDRFSKIIGVSRTNDFYKTDSEFRKRMIERLKKLKEERRGNLPR